MTPRRNPSRARELWAWMRVRKRWWLLPTALILVGMALFISLAEGSVALPFIYTLF